MMTSFSRGAGRLPMVVLAVVLAGSAAPAGAGTVSLNFETAPFPTAAQPDNYNAAGAMQTYSVAGAFSISGGVVLGNPTFLKEFPTFGSPPNLSAHPDIAAPSLLPTIPLEPRPLAGRSSS